MMIDSFRLINASSFDEFDQQYSEGYLHNHHLRDAFINSALDRELAYCIFQTIFGKGSYVLQSIKIRVTGAGYTSRASRSSFIAGFQDVLAKLGRSHRVLRTDDGRLEVELVGDFDLDPMDCSFSFMLPFVRHVFQEIWSPKTDNWWESWHSLPLAATGHVS
jgi:hypothetical protein